MEYDLILINPKTLKYQRAFSALSFEACIEWFELNVKDDYKVYVIVGHNQFSDIFLNTKILKSNLEGLNNLLLYYAIEWISDNQNELINTLYQVEDKFITEQEMQLFKLLESSNNKLLLSKVTLNGIATMAICQEIETKDTETIIKPLFIAVNEELYKQLSPPDEIRSID